MIPKDLLELVETMSCPFCDSEGLLSFDEGENGVTHCCENCGGSFQIMGVQEDGGIIITGIQEPQG